MFTFLHQPDDTEDRGGHSDTQCYRFFFLIVSICCKQGRLYVHTNFNTLLLLLFILAVLFFFVFLLSTSVLFYRVIIAFIYLCHDYTNLTYKRARVRTCLFYIVYYSIGTNGFRYRDP